MRPQTSVLLPIVAAIGAVAAGLGCNLINRLDEVTYAVCEGGGTCNAIAVQQVVAGESHSCALLDDGRVKCWGWGNHGQLGQGSIESFLESAAQTRAPLPSVDLGTGKSAVQIAAGGTHSCAVLNEGSVKCWGDNSHGQLGIGDARDRGDASEEMGDHLPAADLGPGKTALQVAAGQDHTCALLDGGSVACWGGNDHGQLGLGDLRARGDGPDEMGAHLPAVDLGPGKTAVQIAAGANHTCALLDGGGVKCWGENVFGQLGQGDTDDRGADPGEMGDFLPPVDLGTGKKATGLAAGGMHTCASLEGGGVTCWGGNVFGQLGLGDTRDRGDRPDEMGDSLPAVDLGADQRATRIEAGGGHTCALLKGGTVKCWGAEDHGQLGLGDTRNRGGESGDMGDKLPVVDLGTGETVTWLAAGGMHTCAALSDGHVKCWGENFQGQLGLGDMEARGDGPREMGDDLPTVRLFPGGSEDDDIP